MLYKTTWLTQVNKPIITATYLPITATLLDPESGQRDYLREVKNWDFLDLHVGLL